MKKRKIITKNKMTSWLLRTSLSSCGKGGWHRWTNKNIYKNIWYNKYIQWFIYNQHYQRHLMISYFKLFSVVDRFSFHFIIRLVFQRKQIDFLQLGPWNKVMLLQKVITTEVSWSPSWTRCLWRCSITFVALCVSF